MEELRVASRTTHGCTGPGQLGIAWASGHRWNGHQTVVPKHSNGEGAGKVCAKLLAHLESLFVSNKPLDPGMVNIFALEELCAPFTDT